jgi:hypothetical protein
MLITFHIKATFWLAPMQFLNGFEEDMETNFNSMLGSMPTNCNVDSSAMPNNTQDLVCKSKVEEDGGTPPIILIET